MAGSSEKAARYISLLDTARVGAAWSELPELIRKVTKHAPQRKILIHTATAEHAVATSTNDRTGRPSTSQGSSPAHLLTLSTTLQTGSEQDVEDAFQAKTCLLWSRWVGLEQKSATADFDIPAAITGIDDKSMTLWTRICIVKSAYIEGTNYIQNDRLAEGRQVFNAALAKIQPHRNTVLSTPQLAYWAEQLLAQLATQSERNADSNVVDPVRLEVFEYWSVIASKTNEVPASTYRNSTSHLARLPIWRKYYEILSAALTHCGQATDPSSNAFRLQIPSEIRKVERAYETELLRVTKFPHANETNAVVELWVEQVVQNWQLLCGWQWQGAELGEGGRNAIARNVLDILYRAATKSFHSTLILRRLFQVHLSLSEFDLAFRAFDTYIELVDRGRIRVAKSQKPEPGHEGDDAVLSTISEAISGLCKFGRQTEARRAYHLCLKLEEWLVTLGIENDDVNENDDRDGQQGYLNGVSTHSQISPALLQTVYRAIGAGKANWARWTPTSEKRSGLQQEALLSLEKACSHGESQIETLYARSLLLAETREISAAIQVAKKALAKSRSSAAQATGWITERQLISQWHLLALLLSSRQDFDSSMTSCHAAFEQFASGDLQLGSGRNASVPSSIEHHFNTAVSNFAIDMECDELQRILEVRITELALIELTEGPEEAVNRSNELLALFSRLFAHVQVPLESPAVSRSLAPPKSSAGTVKSTRTSIFGRRRHEGQTVSSKEKNDDIASGATNATRPSTQATQGPVIQVTNEDEKGSPKKHHLRKSHDGAQGKVEGAAHRLSHRLTHRGHDEKYGQTNTDQQQGTVQDGISAPGGPFHNGEGTPTPAVAMGHDGSAEGKQELPKVDHNLASHDKVPPPASHDEQPPQQDVRLPTVHPFTNATSPPTRFSKAAAQKQALTILAKVWLVIATLYRRANMFEDSKEACEEASKAAAKMESIVSAIDHSARAFAKAEWGAGTESPDEVWADVYCERAELQLATYKQKLKENKSINNEELRTAVDHYEQCLMFVPDHPAGIIGLSNVLLDSFERKVDLSRRVNDGRLQLAEQEHSPGIIITTSTVNETATQPTNGLNPRQQRSTTIHQPEQSASPKPDEDLKKTPENLNRIAARDRAYGLLSTLTKLGTGWDNSEAWFALARAHELGGEIEKAKDILWYCIGLEDSKPIRHWRNLGYSL